MATLSIRNVRKIIRGRGGSQGRRHRSRGRRVRGAGRPVGMREVHAAGDDRGARDRDVGRDPYRRAHGQFGAAQGPRHRDGVPVLRALPDDDRAREHHLRDGEPRRAEGGAERGGGARGGVPADRAAAQAETGAAFRRPAAARRDGTRARARPEPVPVRRAAVEPRRQAAHRHAHRDQEAAPQRRQDDDLRHPRPGRGDDARLAHRGHAQGRGPAVRPAARRSTRGRRICSWPGSWARRR